MIPQAPPEIDANLGAFETVDYTMEDTGHAFSAVIDTLYSDKVLSPKREYMTNAADAHIEAGHSKPFKVQLPTSLEPTFSVTDFGPGMDPERVKATFTRAFSSTKQTTNSQTGYLGLGSKAIFAYTSAGTLVTRKDGTEWTYVLSRKSDGKPQCTLTSTRETSEPNGTTISYAVKSHDISAFKKAAEQLLVGFRNYQVQPEYNVEVKPMYAEENLVYEIPGVEIYSTQNYGYNTTWNYGYKNAWIRQGPVLYPLPQGMDLNWLNNYHSIIITVPIGSVGVATSREALSVDEETKELIAKLVQDAKDKVTKEVEDKLKDCKTYIEACKLFFKNYGFVNLSPSYDGKKVVSYITGKIDGIDLADQPGNQILPFYVNVHCTNHDQKKYVYLLKGEKVPRLKKRFEEIDDGNHSYLRNVTRDQLKEIRETFEFKPEQFIDIATVPDPGPDKRPKQLSVNGTVQPRPYIITAYDWEQIDLPTEYFWLQCSGKRGKIDWPGREYLGSGAGWFRDSIRTGVVTERALFKDGLPDHPVVFFTPSMVKKIQPDINLRFDYVLATWLKNHTDELIQILLYQDFKAYSELSDGFKIGTPDLVLDPSKWYNFNRMINQYRSVLGDTEYQKLYKEAESRTASIKSKYPMIFNPNKTQKQVYIKLIDTIEKEKENKNV